MRAFARNIYFLLEFKSIDVFQRQSEHIRGQVSVLCNAHKHARSYFFAIVKSKGDVGKTGLGQNPVRAFLPFHAPAELQQCTENSSGFNGSPLHNRTIGKQV